jgi:UDP-3-O-[3-hydroxymyristoyl] glucosamine N-acyltransferase
VSIPPEPPGIRLPSPAAARELSASLGGSLDEGAEPARIDWVVAASVAVAARDADATSWLVPVFTRKHLAARESGALLLIPPDIAPLVDPGRRWVHEHASWTLARVLELALPAALPGYPGGAAKSGEIAASAQVSGGAQIEPGATILSDGEVGPGVVLMAGARIGARTVLEPNVVVFGNVDIGEDCRIGAGSVIGRPGFGWVRGPGGDVRRMPQLAGVIIEDGVEIGALCTVDAGTLAPTRICSGVRLDAHVHVGHNVVLGERVYVAAQSGFAGSSRVEPDVLVGGQAGIADHVVIGRRARIAAKAGVIGDVPEGRTVAGYPAIERMRWLRALAKLLRSPHR